MAFLFLTIAFTLNAIANILLKIAAKNGISIRGFTPLEFITHHALLSLGLFLFAVNVIFYILALRTMPISTAYPIMIAMSFLIIHGYAYFLLRESIQGWQILGYFLIVLGLLLVILFTRSPYP